MAKKILIVDDDKVTTNIAKRILEEGGYTVTIASDGAQAFDIFEGNGFDMVLVDIRMPTLSGYDLLQLLKEKASHKVPVVYITVLPKDEVNMEGADGFIKKPFTQDSLIKDIGEIFENFKA